jgi:hypothetical protein
MTLKLDPFGASGIRPKSDRHSPCDPAVTLDVIRSEPSHLTGYGDEAIEGPAIEEMPAEPTG